MSSRKMPSRTAHLVAALSLLLALPSASAAEQISATFDVLHSGAKVGEVEWKIRLDDDGKVDFHTVNRTVGLAKIIRDVTVVEHSRGTLTDGDYRSDSYLHERSGDKRAGTVKASFDWATSELTIASKGKRKNETRVESLQEPIMDDVGHVLALGAALAGGDTSLSFRILRRDKVRVYAYTFEGRERLDTVAGEVDTVRLRRKRANGKRETVIWSAPSLRYLPVRLAHREKNRRIEINLRTWSHDK